jgi:glycosyltransferase involved in cell wall biosynthesis
MSVTPADVEGPPPETTGEAAPRCPPLRQASVVISSYNYADYLPACIESALTQTYPWTEVVVVDDGSTDGSRRMIREYGRRIVPVLKENGGQASSMNAGFRASRGDVVLFMDSDDLLDPTAVATAIELLPSGVVKAHWPLAIITGDGKRIGRLQPALPLGVGDLRERALTSCPTDYRRPPTTGNAWSRAFLECIFPMPEKEFLVCPDYYLSALAPLYGPIAAHAEPLGAWRLHGRNASFTPDYEDMVTRGYRVAEAGLVLAEEHCARLGLTPNPIAWRTHSYEHRLYHAMHDVISVIPEGRAFALADAGQWGANVVLRGRPAVSFLGCAGQYWGEPADDHAAMEEVSRLREAEVSWLVIAWPCYWWRSWYTQFARFLDEECACLLRNERVLIYRLDRA